jgi:serine/threonine protein phosphatase 1
MLSALRFPKPSANPRLPDGVRIYAINDIHGCAHLLERMLAVIGADVAHGRPYRAIEVFLGDYIDRGPDSRSTLDLLIRRARGGNAVFSKGNHEAFLAEVFRAPSRISDWFRWVHGHTPVRSAEILANRANIDTGPAQQEI